jgi:predicted CoA-binding protein
MQTQRNVIDAFLSSPSFAIVGVSADRKKFGNSLYRALRERGMQVFPVHKTLDTVEGDRCYRSIRDLKGQVKAVVTVVPPAETEKVVQECVEAGVEMIWMQQGSESGKAVSAAVGNGMRVVAGECLFMFAEPVSSIHAFHRWFNKIIGKYPRTV